MSTDREQVIKLSRFGRKMLVVGLVDMLATMGETDHFGGEEIEDISGFFRTICSIFGVEEHYDRIFDMSYQERLDYMVRHPGAPERYKWEHVSNEYYHEGECLYFASESIERALATESLVEPSEPVPVEELQR